jgi:hypothetical protein
MDEDTKPSSFICHFNYLSYFLLHSNTANKLSKPLQTSKPEVFVLSFPEVFELCFFSVLCSMSLLSSLLLVEDAGIVAGFILIEPYPYPLATQLETL